MKITEQQFRDITFALTLAEYFVDGQEPSSECYKIDLDTLERAQRAVAEVDAQNENDAFIDTLISADELFNPYYKAP
jgi:hypothetical protein